MEYDSTNPFALILKGEIPATVVEQNEHTFTFMDIMPKSPGHVLVIPKVQAANLFDIPDEALGQLITQVKRVARAAKTLYPQKGIRVIQLNDAAAGQSVFHIHFHVIPSADGMNFGFHGAGSARIEDLEEIASQYRSVLEAMQ